MGFDFRDIGRELQGIARDIPGELIDALNPINGIARIGESGEKIIGIVGHTVDNTINKASSTLTSLMDMMPLILIGGGLILILTKK